mmetsp:Transcript_50971/g.100189  ORF Transcript_50971/g.100189 Transcript_50971/m.100189 type:complete len:285 (-) Transcript_50971:652-1506(-)
MHHDNTTRIEHFVLFLRLVNLPMEFICHISMFQLHVRIVPHVRFPENAHDFGDGLQLFLSPPNVPFDHRKLLCPNVFAKGPRHDLLNSHLWGLRQPQDHLVRQSELGHQDFGFFDHHSRHLLLVRKVIGRRHKDVHVSHRVNSSPSRSACHLSVLSSFQITKSAPVVLSNLREDYRPCRHINSHCERLCRDQNANEAPLESNLDHFLHQRQKAPVVHADAPHDEIRDGENLGEVFVVVAQHRQRFLEKDVDLASHVGVRCEVEGAHGGRKRLDAPPAEGEDYCR